MKRSSIFCPQCRKLVLAERDPPNHLLHLILSVVTFGFWIAVWILMVVLSRHYNCSRCGMSL